MNFIKPIKFYFDFSFLQLKLLFVTTSLLLPNGQLSSTAAQLCRFMHAKQHTLVYLGLIKNQRGTSEEKARHADISSACHIQERTRKCSVVLHKEQDDCGRKICWVISHSCNWNRNVHRQALLLSCILVWSFFDNGHMSLSLHVDIILYLYSIYLYVCQRTCLQLHVNARDILIFVIMQYLKQMFLLAKIGWCKVNN